MLEGLVAVLLGVLTLVLGGLVVLGALAGRAGYRLWRIFVRKGREPMPPELYGLFRRVKTLGAHLAGSKGVGRLLALEVAPGIQRLLIDVSSKGQITVMLTHMHQQRSPRATISPWPTRDTATNPSPG